MPNRLARTARAAVVAVAITVPAALRAQEPASSPVQRVVPAAVKHTVKPGDTLWDIARYYLKDPFKWPEVFHANTDIVKNPHWIYPGQILTIDAAAVKPEIVARVNDGGTVVAQIQTRAQAPTVFGQTGATPTHTAVRSTTLPPALTVRPGEYAAAPYVVAAARPAGAAYVVGPVDVPALGLKSDAGFKLFDRVYVVVPGGSMRIGDRFVVGTDDAEITDVGRVVEPTGILRIDSLAGADRAIAVLVQQFGAVSSGQHMFAPGQSFEATTVRPVAGSYPLTAKLMWIQGSPKLPSLQSYVILGATESQGINPGDQFTLLDDRSSGDGSNSPVEGTARVTIVRVTPLGSTGIVVSQMQAGIRTGMPARLSAKMP